MKRIVVTCLTLALLAGCGVVRNGAQHAVEGVHGMDATTHALGSPMSTAQTFWVLDGVSVINTKKTIDDHIVGWVTDQDCSTIKASKGEPYCQDYPAKVPTVSRTAYCYKNLSGVTCYAQPLGPEYQMVGVHTEQVPLEMRP